MPLFWVKAHVPGLWLMSVAGAAGWHADSGGTTKKKLNVTCMGSSKESAHSRSVCVWGGQGGGWVCMCTLKLMCKGKGWPGKPRPFMSGTTASDGNFQTLLPQELLPLGR